MVGTRPMVLPWDLIDLDQFLIWSLSLIISGSLAAIGNWVVLKLKTWSESMEQD